MASPRIVGDHLIIRKVAELAGRLAATRHPVLISGERGTGRHLLATVLHARGPRAGASLVTVDCRQAALDDPAGAALVDSVESARCGTLFFKDVEWIDEAAEERVLAALAARNDCDIRLVMSCAAAGCNVQREPLPPIARQIGALTLFLPPLRERRCDIPALVEHFLAVRRAAGEEARLDAAAALALWRYDWPGNVRQLREEVERAAELSGGDLLGCDCFSDGVCRQAGGTGAHPARPFRSGAPLRHFAPQWGASRAR